MTNQANEYARVAKLLHWVVALLIIVNFIIGLVLDATRWYDLHKQIGVTIFFLVVLRLLWRFTTKYPSAVEELSRAEKFFSNAGQGLLYLLMFAIPALGILMVQAYGHPLTYLGIIKLPTLIGAQSDGTKHLIAFLHKWLAYGIITIALAHALFALKHHFINKDSVLTRILP